MWPLILPAVIGLLLAPQRPTAPSFGQRLSNAAIALTAVHVIYDPAYFRIPYPNGDVPPDRGVCTDVVIRAYRQLGIDLQRIVHEDMVAHFQDYPHLWGMTGPDSNIDHRRVPNLMTFFDRHHALLAISSDPTDYRPGDLVCWDLGGGILHIGIVVDRTVPDGTRHLIVHNIGGGQVMEDRLFAFPIIGHYRYGRWP
ncbi:MAG: DUF1287 domain-containing protein [Flavobacteriales bacterium]|nr:DUF1287 domain-containing protein [Flavobacteriales bacterium]